MHQEEQQKPKLTYEQVQQIIDEQLERIEAAEHKAEELQYADKNAVASLKAGDKKKFLSRITKLFKRKPKHN